MRKYLIVLTAFIVATLLSCQDGGFLPELNSGVQKPRVLSITEGSIVSPGQPVPITINTSVGDQSADKLLVRLKPADGSNTIISELSYGGDQLSSGSLPPIQLPALTPGTYILDFLLYSGPTLLKEESTTFFYDSGSYLIQSVIAYPSTLSPGSDGLLKVIGSIPHGASAYVRWSAGGKVLKAGSTSSGNDSLEFTAPDAEGVYSYLVELFPRAPSNGDYSFRSPLSREIQVVVSSKPQSPSSTDLKPEGDFLTVFHFQGNISDLGRSAPGVATVIGTRNFDYQNGVLGYQLGDGNAFGYAKSLIPDLSTTIASLSYCFRILPLETDDGVVFHTASLDGKSGLEISLVDRGGLDVHVWGSQFDKDLVVEGVAKSQTPLSFQVTLARLQQSVQVVLTVDQTILGQAVIALGGPATNEMNLTIPGDTSFGAADGPGFLMDEFGVYSPDDSSGDDAYYLGMRYKYGSALKFASTFADSTLPAGVTVSGDVRSDGTKLLIPPGASVTLPSVALQNLSLLVELNFQRGQTPDYESLVSLLISPQQGAGGSPDPVNIRLNGQISQGNRIQNISSLYLSPLSFHLKPLQDGLHLVLPGVDFPIRGSAESGQTVTVRVSHDVQALVALNLNSVFATEESSGVLVGPSQ